MAYLNGPRIVTDGLVLNLDAASVKSFDPVNPNVELLLHMDGANNSTTFTDSSKNGFTVTANGNAKISTDQSKFGGSSAYFDGNGDFLQIADNGAFEIGGGDFTFEAWIYLTGYSPSYNGYYTASIINKDTNNARSYVFQINGTSSSWTTLSVTLFSSNTSYVGTQASYTFALNTWYHVAASRNGTSLRLYVNGVDIGGGTNSTVAQNTSATIEIGSESPYFASQGYGYYFPGYIDELRIVKGKALYTSNFTPERKPYLDGNKIYDLSGNENNGTLVNGPTYSSDNYGVLSFDGSNSIGLPLSNNLKNTSYTISAYLKSNVSIQNGTTERYMYYFRGTTTGSNRFGVLFGFSPNTTGNNGRLSLVIGNGGWNTYSTSQSSWLSNTWYNIVVTQSGSSYKFYVNGVLVNSGTAVIPVFSGMDANTSGTNWNGQIPNLLVYNRALSSDEIRMNYDALKGRYGLT